ncbi:MAG TPA: hypothetical protein VJM51_05810 [Dehalococcoidia bacterium]|nr:hypothetical protein [Dehalococcoidia bacterium]HLC30278.1 hypothetical protein [Dehalococcoidia bacterium]
MWDGDVGAWVWWTMVGGFMWLLLVVTLVLVAGAAFNPEIERAEAIARPLVEPARRATLGER